MLISVLIFPSPIKGTPVENSIPTVIDTPAWCSNVEVSLTDSSYSNFISCSTSLQLVFVMAARVSGLVSAMLPWSMKNLISEISSFS